MIPTHEMLIDLWQKVAAGSPISEPHVVVAPGPNGIYTAAFLDTDDHKPYIAAAEHLFVTERITEPSWLAAMSPCHWMVTTNPDAEAGDAQTAFANGNPDAHESIAVAIATLDGPVRTIMYDQPLLEPSTDIMDAEGGRITELLTWLLATMHASSD